MLALLVFASMPLTSAFAQSYSIDWHKIAGGGGTSTNVQYSLSGTIGQPDASTALTGGNYTLTGGFWAIYAVQTPGAPLLTIVYTSNQALVSWPLSATGWTLQTNGNVATTNWVNYAGSVVNNTVTNTTAGTRLFYRLFQP